MKHQIKHRYTDTVLFECGVPDDVQASGIATRYALEKAVKDDANLYGATLCGANLRGADLYGATLCGANLYDANLYGAPLCGANLRGADLCGADMDGKAKLMGDRPVLMVGPIGSRCDYMTAYRPLNRRGAEGGASELKR